MTPLEHPLWTALHGSQVAFGRRVGGVAGFLPEVGMFAAFAPDQDHRAWDDLAAFTGPGGSAVVVGLRGDPPTGWRVDARVPGRQLLAPALPGAAAPAGAGEPSRIVELSERDVPDMLDLAGRTRPGPFLRRTVELGRYVGVRRSGRLIAMAGERMRPPGHTEISAVCTDPEFRGQGLAARLVTTIADGIHARGETPFLHVAESNTGAIRMYERLGFQPTRRVLFAALTAPH